MSKTGASIRGQWPVGSLRIWGRIWSVPIWLFESDLPASAGLSSSSALVVGTFMALARCNDLDRDPRWRRDLPTRERLAAYLGAVENGRSYGSFPVGRVSELAVETRTIRRFSARVWARFGSTGFYPPCSNGL